jgi:hypothetical protein
MNDENKNPLLDYVASDLKIADEIMRSAGLSEEDRARILFRHLRAGDAGCGSRPEHVARLQHEIGKLHLEIWRIGYESPIKDERWHRGEYSDGKEQS